MRKITKVLSVMLCAALMLDLQTVTVWAEEEVSGPAAVAAQGQTAEDPAQDYDAEIIGEDIPDDEIPDALTDEEAEPAEFMPEAEESVEEAEPEPADEPEGTEEAAEAEAELLGDGEALYYTPYKDASYRLRYHVLEDKTISIDGYDGEPKGRLVIPNTIGRRKVTKIEDGAFENCSGFTGDLIIPDSVKEIQGVAFSNCSGFNGHLTIGKNVEIIGYSAFEACSGFTGDLIIPDSVTELGNYAFAGCSGFNGSLTIGNGVEKIGSATFINCNGFSGNLTIGDGVKTIADYVFSECYRCTGMLTLGRSLEGLDSPAFIRDKFYFGAALNFRMVTNRSSVPIDLSNSIYFGCTDWYDKKTGRSVDPTKIAEQTVYRDYTFDARDVDEFTHARVADQVYTGFPVKPVIEVYHRQKPLDEKKDYTIKYTDNTNVGTATFTITGKGDFSGSTSDTFLILAKNIAEEDVIVAEIPAVKENGQPYNPVPTVTYNGKKLAKGKDFKILYYSRETDAKNKNLNTVNPTGAGIYYARIDGMNNFKSYVVKPFMIAASDASPVSKLTVAKIKDIPYDIGQHITLNDDLLVVKDGKKKLVQNKHFYVEYFANAGCNPESKILPGPEEVGTYYVRITGKNGEGFSYAGSRVVSFKIVGTPISKYKVEDFEPTLTYNGADRKQSIKLSDKDGNPVDPDSYTVSYTKDRINAGTVTMFVTGTKGITGTIKKTYKITPYDAARDAGGALTVEAITAPVPYAKSGAKPKVTVKFNDTVLKEGKDYTLTYTNNKAIADEADSKVPTVKVTGKGNFKGTNDNLKTTFTIVAADMSATGVHVVAKDVVYTDKDFGWMQKKFSVVDQDGKALKAGTDYDAATIEYRFNTDTGALIEDKVISADTKVCVVVHAKPGSNYTGTATGYYRIAQQDIGKLTVNAISKTYTGKDVTIKPSDIIWKAKGKIIHDVEIEIDESSYKNNVKKGKATVTVRGTGPNYCGSKTITFGIGVRKILWWWL
ncbi:MAG: leucine-rich repeat domain-containing protein [Lachnospiraceae bacterium]|nr:leucine-rich repeat domain-containing protein [Lachnospiraceae bacterium]